MWMNLTHPTAPAMIARISRIPTRRIVPTRLRRSDPPGVGSVTSGMFSVSSSISVTFASRRWIAVQVTLKDVDRFPLVLGGTPAGTRQPLARSGPSDGDRRQALVHQLDAHRLVQTPRGQLLADEPGETPHFACLDRVRPIQPKRQTDHQTAGTLERDAVDDGLRCCGWEPHVDGTSWEGGPYIPHRPGKAYMALAHVETENNLRARWVVSQAMPPVPPPSADQRYGPGTCGHCRHPCRHTCRSGS